MWAVPCAARHRVCISWPDSLGVKVFQVQFDKGGFFVHFPYHPQSVGALGRFSIPTVGRGIDITDLGKVTCHRVKYTHHLDGESHFSQDSKIYTVVRNPAHALLTKGPGFRAFGVDLAGLERFEPATIAERNAGARIDLPTLEPSIRLVGTWVRATSRLVKKMRNPIVVPDKRGGPPHYGVALAPPVASLLNGYVLLLQTDSGSTAPTDSDFKLWFMGGFEFEPARGLRYLHLQYPFNEGLELTSVDLVRDTDGNVLPFANDPPAWIEVRRSTSMVED
jgi:hypothetical protein